MPEKATQGSSATYRDATPSQLRPSHAFPKGHGEGMTYPMGRAQYPKSNPKKKTGGY